MAFSPLNGLKKYTLENGLAVYLKKDSRMPVVSIQLWVNAGALDESADNNGVSHFLEHMLFKGTKNYTVSDISHIVESYGGVINAGTSREYTEYYIDISKTGFIQALKIIADIAQNAALPPEELERERTVVLEEIKRSDDKPEDKLYETFNKQLFSATTYRWRVLGTTASVNGLTRDKVVDYYSRLYSARNMLLVITGDIELKGTLGSVKEYFSYLKPGEKNSRVDIIEPVKPPSTRKVKKDVQQDYMMCGFLGPVIDSEDQYPGDLLSVMLGSGLSSRFYRIIREEKQLAYSIGCEFYTQQGRSIFLVSSVSEPKNTEEVIKEVALQFERVLSEKIDKAEIERAKEIIRSNWYFGQETCNGQAGIIGYWGMIGRLDYVKTYIEKINRINESDLKRFVKAYFKGLTVTVVSPE